VTTTIEIGVERLEVLLLFSRIEAIQQLGRSLQDDETNRGVLRNVDALIRRNAKTPKEGLVFTKQLPGHGSFTGCIVSIDVVDDEKIFKVAYDNDDDEEALDEGGITGLLDVYGERLHQRVIDAILPAFDYLGNRLTGISRSSLTASTLSTSAVFSGSSTRRTLPSTRRQLTRHQFVNFPSLLLSPWSEVGNC